MEITAKRYTKIKSIINGCQSILGTTDPFNICKLLDFKICFIPLSDGIYGFNDVSTKIAASLKSQEKTLNSINATIFLSDKLNPFSQKIVCAHELGHIFLQGNECLNLFDVTNDTTDLRATAI